MARGFIQIKINLYKKKKKEKVNFEIFSKLRTLYKDKMCIFKHLTLRIQFCLQSTYFIQLKFQLTYQTIYLTRTKEFEF